MKSLSMLPEGLLPCGLCNSFKDMYTEKLVNTRYTEKATNDIRIGCLCDASMELGDTNRTAWNPLRISRTEWNIEQVGTSEFTPEYNN